MSASLKSIAHVVGVIIFAVAVVAMCAGVRQGEPYVDSPTEPLACNNPKCSKNPANRGRDLPKTGKICTSWGCSIYRFPTWDSEMADPAIGEE